MKMKINPSAKGLVILFSLLASAILTLSEYVDCESLFPDENLDLSGIPTAPENQSSAARISTFIILPSAEKYSLNSHLLLAVFPSLSLSFNSRMAIAAILLC
jgi:hypothetical protein